MQKRKLYPYQKEAVTYLKNTPNAALFMEMRLGKSLSVIRALRKDSGRKLIVCPKSVLSTWQYELEAENISDYAMYTSSELKKYFWKPDAPKKLPTWCLLNYEAATRVSPKWLDTHFDTVILDESVRIKDPKTKLTKFFTDNFRSAKRRIILSGNPAPNTPLEYYCQFKFLYGKWLNCENYWQFRNNYFTSDIMGYQFWIRSNSKETLKLEIQKAAFVLTRKQAGLANKKIYQKRIVTMPTRLRKLYNHMLEEFFVNMPSGTRLETKYILPQLSYLQQLAGGHIKKQEVSRYKINELLDLLKGELKGESVVVWSWFTWEIIEIQKALQQANIASSAIMGKTSLPDRQLIQKRFQDQKISVLCMQVATGKYGLNLSHASTAIYFSNSLKPDDRNQSEYRIEHNEKKEPLLYIDIVAKDTVDDSILKALLNKRKNAYYFLGDVVEDLKQKYEISNH